MTTDLSPNVDRKLRSFLSPSRLQRSIPGAKKRILWNAGYSAHTHITYAAYEPAWLVAEGAGIRWYDESQTRREKNCPFVAISLWRPLTQTRCNMPHIARDGKEKERQTHQTEGWNGGIIARAIRPWILIMRSLSLPHLFQANRYCANLEIGHLSISNEFAYKWK